VTCRRTVNEILTETSHQQAYSINQSINYLLAHNNETARTSKRDEQDSQALPDTRRMAALIHTICKKNSCFFPVSNCILSLVLITATTLNVCVKNYFPAIGPRYCSSFSSRFTVFYSRSKNVTFYVFVSFRSYSCSSCLVFLVLKSNTRTECVMSLS